MYRRNRIVESSIETNDSQEGETLEMKIERIVNNKEPITDGAPTIYTERQNGVEPGYDIRTDRFDVAIDAMDKVAKTHRGRREDRLKNEIEKYNAEQKSKENGGRSEDDAKTTQGTE